MPLEYAWDLFHRFLRWAIHSPTGRPLERSSAKVPRTTGVLEPHADVLELGHLRAIARDEAGNVAAAKGDHPHPGLFRFTLHCIILLKMGGPGERPRANMRLEGRGPPPFRS
jgi:hypothetical protein